MAALDRRQAEALSRADGRRVAASGGLAARRRPRRRRNVFVSGRASHEPLLVAELPEVPRARLVLEPVRRNTAPAIALSALAASEEAPDAVLAVLPSDQAVRDEPAFLAALPAAAEAARTHEAFVTLGIPRHRPRTHEVRR